VTEQVRWERGRQPVRQVHGGPAEEWAEAEDLRWVPAEIVCAQSADKRFRTNKAHLQPGEMPGLWGGDDKGALGSATASHAHRQIDEETQEKGKRSWQSR